VPWKALRGHGISESWRDLELRRSRLACSFRSPRYPLLNFALDSPPFVLSSILLIDFPNICRLQVGSLGAKVGPKWREGRRHDPVDPPLLVSSIISITFAGSREAFHKFSH